MKTLIVLLCVLMFAGCSSKKEESIGSVSMKEDGTLVFILRADSGNSLVGGGYFEIKREDQNYEMYLSHVSPISSGEEKSVKPWPDEE